MSGSGQQRVLKLIDTLGRRPREFVFFVLDIIGMISIALRSSIDILEPSRRPVFFALFKRQLYKTGVRALYLNGAIAALVGALLMARLFAWFPRQVVEEQYAHFFVVVVVRELGPLISGVILIAMSATATTAEIGFLRVFREFEVLNGLGINPVFLFLLPVFFAFPLSLVLMMIYFDCICIVSSYVFILLSDHSIAFLPFVSGILDEVVFNEVAVNLVKAVLGGMLIGVISIYFGARATESYEDVSDAIAKSTTSQLLVFFLLNVMLSLLAYSQ